MENEQNKWPEMRPMADAPKDGVTRILVKMRDDLEQFDTEGTRSLSRWNGRFVVIRHEGFGRFGGYDLGWSVAAPVGYGGLDDHWMDGWWPLPNGAA